MNDISWSQIKKSILTVFITVLFMYGLVFLNHIVAGYWLDMGTWFAMMGTLFSCVLIVCKILNVK